MRYAPHTPTSASQTILSDCSVRSASLPPWASNTSGEYEVVVYEYAFGKAKYNLILTIHKHAEQQLYTRIEQTPIWDTGKPKARKRENFYFLYFRWF